MKGAVWFILSCKRCLKRLPFLALLFLLPLGALALSGTGRGEDDRIRIALCAQDPSGLAVRTVQALTEPSKMRGDMFVFYACEDEEEVRAQVASRRANAAMCSMRGLRRNWRPEITGGPSACTRPPPRLRLPWPRRRCLRPWFKIMTGISWRTMWRLDRPLRAGGGGKPGAGRSGPAGGRALRQVAVGWRDLPVCVPTGGREEFCGKRG